MKKRTSTFLFLLTVSTGATLLLGAVTHQRPDFSWAYKFVGAPGGVILAGVSFVVLLRKFAQERGGDALSDHGDIQGRG